MLSNEFVCMKDDLQLVSILFLCKLFLGVRYNSLMIFFENASKYSNASFWLVSKPQFPSDFLVMRASGNKLFFLHALGCFFFFIWHSDDSKATSVNILGFWTCWSCSRFFGPYRKCNFANVISSFQYRGCQKIYGIQFIRRFVGDCWNDWAAIWKKWTLLSFPGWMNRYFGTKLIFFTDIQHIWEIIASSLQF